MNPSSLKSSCEDMVLKQTRIRGISFWSLSRELPITLFEELLFRRARWIWNYTNDRYPMLRSLVLAFVMGETDYRFGEYINEFSSWIMLINGLPELTYTCEKITVYRHVYDFRGLSVCYRCAMNARNVFRMDRDMNTDRNCECCAENYVRFVIPIGQVYEIIGDASNWCAICIKMPLFSLFPSINCC